MVKLILSDILKHKTLFILNGVLVALLTFYLLVGLNAGVSISRSLRIAVAENVTGDMIIASKKAGAIDMMNRENEKEIVPLNDWEEMLRFLKKLPEVSACAPRLRVGGRIKSDRNEAAVVVIGIDAESERTVLPKRSVDEGTWLAGAREVNLYYRHADALSASVGDTVAVIVPTVDGYENLQPVRLAGTFDYADCMYYHEFSYHAFVDLRFLNTLRLSPANTVTEFHVRLHDAASFNHVQRALVNRFGAGFRCIAPQRSSPLVSGVYTLTIASIDVVAGLLIVMVYLCSSFLISVSMESRRREIGIYMALGVKRWKIGALFGGEFILVGGLFALVGMGIGCIALHMLSVEGIEAGIIPLQLIFGRSVLRVTSHWQTLIALAGLIAFSSIVTIASTILRLGNLDPVEVLREI